MVVNEFESSNTYRLRQIISTLKNIHNFNLDLDSKSTDQIRSISEGCEVAKNNIVKESAFNSWMQNPEYTKNMLILEAVKIYLTEIAPKRMSKKTKKVKESIEETSPSDVVDNFKLGKEMINYAQNSSYVKDEKEVHLMNLISKVGDKLTQVGTPFGPTTLTDMDKKIIEIAKRRMGLKPPHPDDVEKNLQGLAELAPTQPTPAKAPATAPAPTGGTAAPATIPPAQQKPNTVSMQKPNSNTIEQVPDTLVGSKIKQGYTVAPNTTDKVNEMKKDMSSLMKKYKVKPKTALEDSDMDESGFPGARAAAIKAGEKSFKVGGKTFPVTGDKEAVAEDWGSSDWSALINYMDRSIESMTKNGVPMLDAIHNAAEEAAEFYGEHLGYSTHEDTVNRILQMYKIRKWGIRESKKTVKEAAHMETHDDYQASMARSELYRNTKYAMDMMKMISPEEEVKPWIAANLTKAAEALDKIYHYMDYHTTFEPDNSPAMNEPVVDLDEETDELGETSGSIARQNLLHIMEYSTKLFRMIEPHDKLEGWVAMKLTSASEAISSSKHYMDYVQFEKHASDSVEDMDQEMAPPPVEETKGKKKKTVKESRLVTIGNILMNSMIKEDQDLAQAQTLLAAKSMSDELQSMAEKLAKMSVEELMPLVDTMKEQFGQEIATGFNDTIKASIEAVLNATTEAKDSTDNAILSMQQGQVPGASVDTGPSVGVTPADSEGGEDMPSSDEAPEDEAPEKDVPPLGRAKKKAPKDDEGLVDIEESKKMENPCWKNYVAYGTKEKDGKTVPNCVPKKKKKKKVSESELNEGSMGALVRVIIALGLGAYGVASWMNSIQNGKETPLGKAMMHALQVEKSPEQKQYILRELNNLDLYIEAGDAKKLEDLGDQFLKVKYAEPIKTQAVNRAAKTDMKEAISEAKKAVEPGAVATAQVMKMKGKFVTKDGKHLTKAGIKKRDEIIKAIEKEGKKSKKNLNEKAKEPGAVATAQVMKMKGKFVTKDGKHLTKAGIKKRDEIIKAIEKKEKVNEGITAFLNDNKSSFKKRYGKLWESKLYAAAWNKFGTKSESYIKTRELLNTAVDTKNKLIATFESHKKTHAKMVTEGQVIDALNTGYGLEGQNILDHLDNTNEMISKFKSMLRSEIAKGVESIKMAESTAKRADQLSTAKSSAPYGVIWTDNNTKKSKFFETADLRKYWLDLNVINEYKLVEPSDFDKRIAELKSRKG